MNSGEKKRLLNMRKKLLDWFALEGRDLPWRSETKPYEVWLSEVMAQQTRMNVVVPYYDRFLKRFPTLESLAEASIQDVLPLWAGLGYYSRAHNLHQAAGIIFREYGGQIPSDYKKLISLPGIGPYTAGAILSIAFGQVVPAIDGNVNRVFARLQWCQDLLESPAFQKKVRDFMEFMIPPERPGDFTQAMMELGALVCLPKTPQCGQCPLQQDCITLKEGQTAGLPLRRPKRKIKREDKTVILVEDVRGKLLLSQRSQRLLKGMWVYFMAEGCLNALQVKTKLAELGLCAQKISCVGGTSHPFTHLLWEMTGYHVLVEEAQAPEGNQWMDRRQWQKLPLPAAMGFYTRWLEERELEEQYDHDVLK